MSDSQVKLYHYPKPFLLESGVTLHELTVAYNVYGSFEHGQPIVWVCHALTANSAVYDWWPGLFGDDALFNSRDYTIICANIIGSHYGSTGPLHINPITESPYYKSFPLITVRDIVAANRLLADALDINYIDCIIGGSLGGMQVLEWLIAEPHRFGSAVLLSTSAQHSPWGIAYNETQRMAIENDRTWVLPIPGAGLNGLRTARSIAMLSYRHYNTYAHTQPRNAELDNYNASSYQHYQGDKLANRFNAYTYWYLSKAMDTHDISRGREAAEKVLAKLKLPVLVLSIDTDNLFPNHEQYFLAQNLPQSQYYIIPSLYGHDGFLIEAPAISMYIKTFLKPVKQFYASPISSPATT